MKTLTQALINAHAAAVQKPAWLVSIAFSQAIYLSSFDTISYAGQTWLKADIDVGKVRANGLKVSGAMVLGNLDDSFAALVLGEGVAGREIRIYGYDAAATGTDDIILLAKCVGGKATVDETRVTISVRESLSAVYTPREFVKAPKFNVLVPDGASFTINNQTYTISRAQQR